MRFRYESKEYVNKKSVQMVCIESQNLIHRIKTWNRPSRVKQWSQTVVSKSTREARKGVGVGVRDCHSALELPPTHPPLRSQLTTSQSFSCLNTG